MSRCVFAILASCILASCMLAGSVLAESPAAPVAPQAPTAGGPEAAAAPPDTPPSKLTPLMRMKLDRSKAILEGLTLEEYDKIASNARALRLLSHESGWNVLQTEEYEAQSLDFRRSMKAIEKAAEDKDISRAALGFVTATVRCVECHRYIRTHGVPVISLDAGVPALPDRHSRGLERLTR